MWSGQYVVVILFKFNNILRSTLTAVIWGSPFCKNFIVLNKIGSNGVVMKGLQQVCRFILYTS